MALRDVKEYYYTMLGQYLEVKNDLADFEQALKDGYITEDKLEEVKQDVAQIQTNIERIQYIMYLFELPNREKKKNKYKNPIVEQYFIDHKVTLKDLSDENISVLDHLRKEIKKYNGDNFNGKN